MLSSGKIELINNKYIEMSFNDHVLINLEELIKREDKFLELADGKKYPVLIDTQGSFIQYGVDARYHNDNAKRIDHLIAAEAFLVDNIGIKMLVKDHEKSNKSGFPIKIFNNKKDALNWLLNGNFLV